MGDPAKALFDKLVVIAAALRMARLCWRKLAGQAAAPSPARPMAVPARRSHSAWTPGRVRGGFLLAGPRSGGGDGGGGRVEGRVDESVDERVVGRDGGGGVNGGERVAGWW